jgi:hypothetical protein
MNFTSPMQNNSGTSERRVSPPFESPGQLALIGLVIWLIGAIIHPLAILSPLGVLLLLVAAIAYLVRPRKNTMYWRGREIELNDDRRPLAELYRTLFRR